MGYELNPLDTSWLLLDSADTPMHVGALLVFRLPPGQTDDDLAHLARRLRAEAPVAAPWTLKMKRGLRLRATWQEAAHTDIEYHFQHSVLPAPGGERELGVLVERLHSAALDPDRPAWECHLIENLHGGRFAIYLKMHHALLDATNFVDLLLEALSDAPQDEPRAFWTLGADGSGRARAVEQASSALRGLAQNAFTSARSIGSAFGRLLRAGGKAAPDLAAPYRAPRSPLNVHIGRQRRVATQQYERARLARAAQAVGADEGELVLYLVASVLRRFLKEHNALPERSLVAALPGQRNAASLGFVALGTQHADRRQRLDVVCASLRASRAHLAALPEAATPAYTLLGAVPFLLTQVTNIGSAAIPLANLGIYSVYGPDAPRFLGGAQLEALYPMFPLVQDVALSVSCLRYAGSLDVAFVGAAEALPRLQRMAVYMGQALAELEEAIAEGSIGPPAV